MSDGTIEQPCPLAAARIQEILRSACLEGVYRVTFQCDGDGRHIAAGRLAAGASGADGQRRSFDHITVSTPVVIHGTVVGTIQVAGPGQARALLAEAARVAAACLAAAWVAAREIDSLAGEVVHAYEELHLLYELGTSLSGDLTVARVADVILEKTLNTLSAEWAELNLSDGQTPLHMRPGRDAESPIAPRGGEQRLTTHLRSAGQIVGTIVLVRASDAMPFSSADVKLLDAVGTLAGNAIRTAQLYQELRRQADTDMLTGVANHRALQERLDTALAAASTQGTPLGIMMIDIDDFKLFNDTYGHLVGDQILRLTSDTLSSVCRENDVVGRYGGDEFVIVLPHTDRAGVAQLASRILDAVSKRGVPLNNHSILPLAISIGCAVFPDDAVLKHDLLSSADASLYETKRRGGNGVFYVPERDGEHAGPVTNTTFGALQGLVNAVDAKDRYTKYHSEAVTEGALLLAKQLGLSSETCGALRIAGLLHDVGKIGIPDRILRKPGPLSEDEYRVMQQHVALSELIIKEVPHLVDVLTAVANHHERYDGRGYPRGLRGEEIPLMGRIMAIADACAAMLLTARIAKACPGTRWSPSYGGAAGHSSIPNWLSPLYRRWRVLPCWKKFGESRSNKSTPSSRGGDTIER